MAKVKWTKEQHEALDSIVRNAKRNGQMPIVIGDVRDGDINKQYRKNYEQINWGKT